MNTFQEAYQSLISQGKIEGDTAQQEVVDKLSNLYDSLDDLLEKKLFRKKAANLRGIYIYGDVGRGKSMLMDLFYEHVPYPKKRRAHFHEFMQDIHARIHEFRSTPRLSQNSDPIYPVAEDIAKEAKILCFDEFQVHDITDAMILARLFKALFEEEVIVIATSNRHPDELYLNGLQREHFLPFIDMLKSTLEVVQLKSPLDYRLTKLEAISKVYFTPLGKEADEFIGRVFRELTHYNAPIPAVLNIQGRALTAAETYGNVAKFKFGDLCEEALGPGDYLEIARRFDTVILKDIPILGPEKRNEAKRFVTLIDALYEHNVKLICTAEAPPQELYKKGDGAFEFERTVSRLIEMQSLEYLSKSHET